MKLFYIDDDIDDIMLFKEAVEEIDVTILCDYARTADEALFKLKTLKLPDLIFLDVNIPETSGKKLLESYKSNPLLRQIPVIMLSTSSAKDDIEDCEMLGAFQYIVKPSDFRKLVNVLQQVLQCFNKTQHTP